MLIDLSYRAVPRLTPSVAVCDRDRRFGLWAPPKLIVGRRYLRFARRRGQPAKHRRRVRQQRLPVDNCLHKECRLSFGFLNIRSINSKFDDVMEL